MLRRVWKLCPSIWHIYSVDNTRHPLDVLADLDVYSDGIIYFISTAPGAWMFFTRRPPRGRAS